MKEWFPPATYLTDWIGAPSATDGRAPGEGEEDFMPGLLLAEQGLSAKHPVFLIPGIISTGLELWETAQRNLACGKRHFRKRFWGTMNQFRGILMDRECWVEHMALDEHTWLDRPGVKVRAAQGFDAADYLYPGYWVWARIISNLAALGYSPDTMHLASYDWRLSFANLEKRDRYFTRLKSNIEAAYENAAIVHGDGEGGSHEPLPVVVITHSMGALVFYYFLNWVRSPLGANAGEAWCDKYLKDWVNIGGPLLGLPKTLSALFTGESKDTTELGTFGTYVFERFFSKRERAEIFRRWPGLSSMNCKGGETLWGTPGAPAPDEHVDGVRLDSFGRRRNTNITAADATADIPSPFRFMHTLIGQPFSGMWDREWDNGLATQRDQLDTSLQHPRTWANPLLSQLPRFPSKRFRIYSFYGLGLDTERAFQYGSRVGVAYAIDVSQHDPATNLTSGVRTAAGDGTVPLLSLGYMPRGGWRHARYNPGGVPVITKEIPHARDLFSLRGGGRTADHVDILGNTQVLEDILYIAAGKGEERVFDQISSEIDGIARNVELPPDLD
ncbi:hypothetical protein CXG81DRAFT_10415 [Caulochytrium protostelioides]|uniref:Lecithin:cholesterol acyltransferase n=1 Tax=Caulochytrium protostelioides TaxID=1555241 RepID=A0A4P9XBH0_9FUNG|nr:hypothetical protein CXG81DRAFT_10415 [Caulochytrium protostelioides]|eukprot:RKP02736.1 hypothetical protein CXG81DRAFT_10415 [Caulochytrium protostelioides]